MTTVAKTYWDFVRSHPWLYVGGILAMLLTTASEVATPKAIQYAVDALSALAKYGPERHSPLSQLYIAIFSLGVIILVGFVGRFGWRQTLARATHLAGLSLKERIWGVLRWQPNTVFERYTIGNIMSRAISDWNQARFIHGFTLILTFDVIFFLSLGSIAMLLIDVYIASFALIILPLLPFMLKRLSKREGLLHLKAQKSLERLSELVSQSLRTIRIQRATATHESWEAMLNQRAENYATANLAVLRTADHFQPISAIPMLAAYAGVFILGLPKIESGSLSVGEFIALLSYVLMLQNPLVEIGYCISDWQKGLKSLSRLNALYNLPRPQASIPNKDEDLQLADCSITLKNICFQYQPTQPLLENLQLNIASGETIGIDGAIGSGKSTLLKLLAGTISPQSGMIYFSATNADTQNDSFFRRHVTFIQHAPEILSGSIRLNLCLDGSFSDTQLWAALENACLAADIKKWPLGLETIIGEHGLNISGGQKQRLSLARAILRPRPIVLLDDCLSAVDAASEAKITLNIRNWLSAATVVIVSHRESSLKLCDRRFSLRGGRLWEENR